MAENLEVMDMAVNDEVTPTMSEDIASAIAECTGKFEFDLATCLITIGGCALAHFAYKHIPEAWRKFKAWTNKKTTDDDYDDYDDEDDEDDDEDDDVDDVDDSVEDVKDEAESKDEEPKTKKPNRATRRKKKNRR